MLMNGRHVREATRVLPLDIEDCLLDFHLRDCRTERLSVYGLCDRCESTLVTKRWGKGSPPW